MNAANMIAIPFISCTMITISGQESLKSEIEMGSKSLVFSLLESHIDTQVDQEEQFIETLSQLDIVGSLGCVEIGDTNGFFPEPLAEPGQELDKQVGGSKFYIGIHPVV